MKRSRRKERRSDETCKALETLLTGPLRFNLSELPDGKRYRIEGEVGLEAMFAVEGAGRCTTDGVPSGIRTRVTALKGLGPGPD